MHHTHTILGSLVADAASLGLHWLYSAERIAQIEAARGLVFLSPQAEDYADVPAYFAHGQKASGDATGYGEVCLLMARHLAQHGEFKRVEYQTEYRQLFGPGGAFVGYVDTATRQTLLALMPLEPVAFPAASGCADIQLPALAALPALVAAHDGDLPALLSKVEMVVRISNHNDLSVAAGQCAAAALFAVLQGKNISAALHESLAVAGNTLRPLLEQTLALPSLDSVAAAQRFGLACDLTQGLPVIFHIAQHARDYRNAVEANIRAGGDSCGRAILLGALVAANQSLQNKTEVIPLTWLARYKQLKLAAVACEQLAAR